MSDTKIQLRNNKNREHINQLNRLYKQERSLRMEIKYVEKQIREGQIYIRDYDIKWLLNIIKGRLIFNQSMIKAERSKLVIC